MSGIDSANSYRRVPATSMIPLSPVISLDAVTCWDGRKCVIQYRFDSRYLEPDNREGPFLRSGGDAGFLPGAKAMSNSDGVPL